MPDKNKTVVVARLTVKPGQEEAFVELASPLIDATRAEEGNGLYALYRSTQNPAEFLFYEEYKDEAAFKAHLASAHFAAFAKASKAMTAGDVLIEQF